MPPRSSLLVAIIDGGNVALSGANQTITLDASRSADPDNAPGPLAFAWTCAAAAAPAAAGAACLGASGAPLALAPGAPSQSVSLLPGASYVFTATVSKGARSASAATTVRVTAAGRSGPLVSVRAPTASGAVNPALKITILANVSSASPATLRTAWSLVSPRGQPGFPSLNLSSPLAVASPPGSASLVLQPSALVAGVTYVLRLNATDEVRELRSGALPPWGTEDSSFTSHQFKARCHSAADSRLSSLLNPFSSSSVRHRFLRCHPRG